MGTIKYAYILTMHNLISDTRLIYGVTLSEDVANDWVGYSTYNCERRYDKVEIINDL